MAFMKQTLMIIVVATGCWYPLYLLFTTVSSHFSITLLIWEKVSFPFFLPLCSCRFLNRSLSHTRSFCYLWWLLYTMYLTLGSQLEALFEVVMAPYWKTYMAKNRLWGLLRWSLLPAFIHTHPSPRMWTGTTSLLSAPALLLCIPCHDVFCWNLNQNTLSFP